MFVDQRQRPVGNGRVFVVLHRRGRRFYDAIGRRRVHTGRHHGTAQEPTGVLPDILPVGVVFPVATGQSALRPGVVQSNRTGLFGRAAVSLTIRPVIPRTVGTASAHFIDLVYLRATVCLFIYLFIFRYSLKCAD